MQNEKDYPETEHPSIDNYDEDFDDTIDDDEYESDEDDEPEYYQCLGCGWSGIENPGDQCPRCCGYSIDGVW